MEKTANRLDFKKETSLRFHFAATIRKMGLLFSVNRVLFLGC